MHKELQLGLFVKNTDLFLSLSSASESTISVRPSSQKGNTNPSPFSTSEASNSKAILNFGIRKSPTSTFLYGRWCSMKPDSELTFSIKDGSPSLASGR
ncbi:hypothetical protein ACJIZ3_002592 [Penstemon smallii]|uniref:Uncharacterized protein n=1 Tax=Penstemon smallii TaxID=265156 RepID=A0ABD3U6T4_9LAMI